MRQVQRAITMPGSYQHRPMMAYGMETRRWKLRNYWSRIKTLAAAYAEVGEFEKAIETLDEIDSNRYSDNMISEMREMFEGNEPFRDDN